MRGSLRTPYLWAEFGVLYLLIPYANAVGWIPLKEKWFLVGLGVLVTILLLFDRSFDRRLLYRPDDFGREMLSILKIFAIFAPLLLALMWFLRGGKLFYLPMQKPWDWLWLMLAYPVISVYPQELIYRAFLCQRYAPILPTDNAKVFASAFVFAFYHIRYWHWVPVFITFIGGLIFTARLLKSRALVLPTIEHSLYGLWAFTLGYGVFFRT